MVDTKTQQRVEHISGTNQSQLKITETKTRRNSVTEKVKQIFGKKILSGSSEGEQITTSIGDVDEEVAENLVDSAQSIQDACVNEGEKVGPVKVSDLLKTVFEHPRQKNTSQIHKHISQWLRNFTSTGIKHMVYLGYLHKDHYITVRDLHRKLQELYGCQSNFPATPDLTLSKISPVNTPILLIDARRPDEYAISHIPGAVNIHSLLSRRVSRHLQNVDPETNIVTYCAAGLRSGWMAARLRHLGFKNVRTLEGFYQWASEGKPMIGEDGSLVRQVLPQHFLASLLLDKDIMFVQTKTTTTNNSKNSKQTTETKVVFKDKNKH